MSFRHVIKTLTVTSLIATVVTVQASAASYYHRYSNSTTRTTFVGGGASLPAAAYEGTSATTSNPSTPVAGSAWYYFMSVLTSPRVTTQYCQTGSGFGKKVYDGLPGATGGVNGSCPGLGVLPNSSNGFGAPAALGLTDPDIVGTDAPLTQAEYSQFISAKTVTRGEPVELPELLGSITLFYNDPDTGATPIKITDSQLCNIVTGFITNWNQLGFSSRTLSFVYRSDGSGTTFALSNHLVALCTGSGLNASQQFAPVGGTAPPYVIAQPPLNSIGAAGNAGVVDVVKTTPGAIGYAETANAVSARNAASGITLALLNGFDPVKNLPEAAAKLNGVTSVVKDSVVVTNGGAATTAPIKPAPPHTGCVLLVKSSAYANVRGGYPILAVSYHLYGYAGNGRNNANLRTLAQELTKSGIIYNNQAGAKNITTIDAATSTVGTGTTGYSTLGASFQTPVRTASDACVNT